MADLGLTTQQDMVTNATMIASLSPTTPVIADADTGYGGPVMVARTVREYARAGMRRSHSFDRGAYMLMALLGIAAFHLEDQVQSKRCGHLMGKQIVSREDFYARIRSARAARDACGSEMLIIARTDARAGELADASGTTSNGDILANTPESKYNEAIARLKGAREAGADILFFEAPTSKEEAGRACAELAPTPVLLNMVPEGVTPNMSVDEAKQCGFRIVIFPTVCIEGVLRGCREELGRLKEKGAMDGDNKGIRAAFELCGLDEAVEIDKAAGGKAYGQI